MHRAGVISERNQKLADALNARNFALAEQTGLPAHEYLQHVSGRYEQRQ